MKKKNLIPLKTCITKFKYLCINNENHIILNKIDEKKQNILHLIFKYSIFYNQTFLIDITVFFNLHDLI